MFVFFVVCVCVCVPACLSFFVVFVCVCVPACVCVCVCGCGLVCVCLYPHMCSCSLVHSTVSAPFDPVVEVYDPTTWARCFWKVLDSSQIAPRPQLTSNQARPR